ncbi:uncharacterized protein LOC135962041 [Calliphora vicina]|uniref:uncharacterized protein LOC135962041 n=1 Tax=Calliphora vicina TaxID=7373 RepID=UPI00325A7310
MENQRCALGCPPANLYIFPSRKNDNERDPDFPIHETVIFPPNLIDESNTIQPVMQIPMIKSVSCSMWTQTNTRLCGSVEISDLIEEYRLNCFYCSEIFPLEKWSAFVVHLREKHFKKEEAFKMSKYHSQDHDYTPIGSPSTSPMKPEIKFNMVSNPIVQIPPSLPVFTEPIILPPLLAKPQKCNNKPLKLNPPPPLLSKPQQSNNKPFNISLADKLIKLLNETVLNKNFLHTEEDNIVIIKNSASSNIETSHFLQNFMNCENISPKKAAFSAKLNTPTSTTSLPKNTRPIYTLNYGQQNIPSRRHSFSRVLKPLVKNKMTRLVHKRVAQQALKNINVFENVYKTVKTRPPKVLDSGILYLKDFDSNKVNERQTSNETPLSRCLKRSSTVTEPENKQFSVNSFQQKPIELVFEYTPEDIIVSLLECIQNYPVLWKFHEQPFNKDYYKAIEEICQIINDKWSLNITSLKMRRSINRILRFYRFMLPSEDIEKFNDYFDKCSLFLPSSIDEIPRARCDYCSICYKSDKELRKHLIEKHKCLKWPYKCQQCHERFRERDEYELHKLLPHFVEIFKCEQCSKRFNRRYLYNKHVSSHQRTIQRNIPTTAGSTQQNDPSSPGHGPSTQMLLQQQQRPIKSAKQNIKPAKYSRELSDGENLFKCPICPKAYVLKSTLNLHLKKHRSDYDFICEVCGKGFIRQSSLNEHMNTHTGAKITCNICNLKLRKCSLSRHLRLVHVATEGTIESTFRAQCYHYKKFMFPKSQQSRTKTVKGNEKITRRYFCKICKINFSRLKQLKDHNKELHFDVAMIPCKMCNIEFKHMHNLKRHYRCKHNLHMYQIFKLVDHNEDLNTVLAIQTEDLETEQNIYISHALNKQHDNVKRSTFSSGENYFEPDRIHSDKIQDEIMKAVENIDKQEIKIDDDHSMNDFFTDLLKT